MKLRKRGNFKFPIPEANSRVSSLYALPTCLGSLTCGPVLAVTTWGSLGLFLLQDFLVFVPFGMSVLIYVY